MKIKDVIKLLETMDEDDDLFLISDVDGISVNNDIYVPCDRCDGTGVATYTEPAAMGFTTGGDYCDPEYKEYEGECDCCDGAGRVRRDPFVEKSSEEMLIADNDHLKRW
jgi:DnaJ-class molecular chaperone